MNPTDTEARYDSRPIIVGGCYRSGTSLVRRLLDFHPRIHCGPEVKFFRDFYGDYIDVQDRIGHLRFIGTAATLVPKDDLFHILGAAFVETHERAASKAGKPRWADKAPENVVYLNDWERLLGDRWVFLHVVRNPLDTLASLKEIGFPKLVPAGVEGRIELYLRYARSGLDFGRRNPERYVRINYEDLVARPRPALHEAMAGLGEKFFPDQLDLDRQPSQRGLEDPKIHVTSAIHSDSAGGWPGRLTGEEALRIVAATAEEWSRLDPAGCWPMPNAAEVERIAAAGVGQPL